MTSLRKNASVLLINPPIDSKSTTEGTEFLPLNLLALHTRLRLSGIDSMLIDLLSEKMSVSDIIHGVKENDVLVGIGIYRNSLQRALDIASDCKTVGAETGKNVRVVFGGAHATLFGKYYVDQYRDIIDGVILGHGEDAMVDLAQGRDPHNLLTIEKQQVDFDSRPSYDTNLDAGFPYDYSDLDLNKYWRHADKNFSTKGSRFELVDLDRPLMINSQRGCYWQRGDKEGIKRCVFCCRPDKKWTGVDPKEFWEKLYKTMSETGANCVSDLCYDFIGNRRWFEALMESKPGYFKYPFKYIFAGGDSLCDENIVRLLREKLNLHAVLNSIEHGDERCQAAFDKVYTAEQTAASLHHLDKFQIASRLSFVVGAPKTKGFEGESEETISNFFEYVKRISGHKCIQLIVGGVLNPVPGSRIYNRMMTKGKHRDEYKIALPKVDKRAMIRHYFEENTKISADRAEEVYSQILSMFPTDVIKAK